MSARFSRSARVRTSAEYAAVFECARRTSEPLLTMHWHAHASPARLGLAVSRKVDKRAVERNRLKRALREEFRQLRPRLPGGDYVVVARPPAARQPSQALREAFARALIRAGALPPPVMTGTMAAAPTPPSSLSSTTSKPAASVG
ncbi:MAG TPA: ribonuclease P protein component [Pseudoxanthomonas sp.]|nr:ribonuclease P protein component [Pseudoxanthomonas sp.]